MRSEPATPPVRAAAIYLVTMLGCEFCEQAKREIVPALQKAGIFVVTIVDFVTHHEIAGHKAKMYPTWIFTVDGQKIGVVEGLHKVDKLIKLYEKARAS
jgi:ABC-type sulfate transport system substrate-binding protein